MKIKPAILQLESHPYHQALEIKAQCAKYWIVLEDWFPLGGQMSQGALFRDPVIMEVAHAHVDENIDIFDFELSADEMQKLRGINKDDPFFKMPSQTVRRMSENSSVVPNFN